MNKQIIKGEIMEKIFNKIIEFLKNIFGSNIENKIDNHSKYNINKNKNCDIKISEKGVKERNEKNK